MGVFEFIIVLVIISTIGKVASEWGRKVPPPKAPPALPPGEAERLRETLDDLAGRVDRLEEERDFYRELLEHPGRKRAIGGPDTDPGSGPDR